MEMEKYYIVLRNGLGCELDRREIGTKAENEPDVSDAIANFARDRVIYPGDTIEIMTA